MRHKGAGKSGPLMPRDRGQGSMMNLLSSGGKNMLGFSGLRVCGILFLNVFYVRAYHGVNDKKTFNELLQGVNEVSTPQHFPLR